MDKLNIEYSPSAMLPWLGEMYLRELIDSHREIPTLPVMLSSMQRYAPSIFYPQKEGKPKPDDQLRRVLRESDESFEGIVRCLKLRMPGIDDRFLSMFSELVTDDNWEATPQPFAGPHIALKSILHSSAVWGVKFPTTADILERVQFVFSVACGEEVKPYKGQEGLELWLNDVVGDLAYITRSVNSLLPDPTEGYELPWKPTLSENGELIPSRYRMMTSWLDKRALEINSNNVSKNGKPKTNKTFKQHSNKYKAPEKILQRTKSMKVLVASDKYVDSMPYQFLEEVVSITSLTTRMVLANVQLIHIAQCHMVNFGVPPQLIVDAFEQNQFHINGQWES